MRRRLTWCTAVAALFFSVGLYADSMREMSARNRLLDGTANGFGVKMRAPQVTTNAHGRIQNLSTSSFGGFVHCPAELGQQCNNPFGSIAMENGNTAFYRDVIIGAYTFISGATDGETWSAVFTDPNGAANNFPGFTFHSNFNGNQNCFVSPFQILCGGTSLDVLWFMQSQCAPTGTWNAQFTNTTIPPMTFELKPQIDANHYLPPQLQGSYPNALSGNLSAPYTSAPNPYDETCRLNILRDPTVLYCPLSRPVPTGYVRWSIANKGCYMTDVAMILTYHGSKFGLSLTPPTLNSILVGIRDKTDGPVGFDRAGGVNPEAAANYARQHGANISYPIPGTSSLSTDICKFGPQLVRVPKNLRAQHWVTAYGVQKDGTIMVRDPAALFTTLPSVIAIRRFSGPEFNFFDQITGMRFTFHSPVELFVTDPTGRRVGFDPLTQTTYNEIPNAFYDSDAGEIDAVDGIPDPNPRKTLELFGDVDGDYNLTVTGTATGVYSADIYTLDSSGNMPRTSLDQIPTVINLVQNYTFTFNHADATQSALSGGFDGGGQRPRDVNKFLTYGNPSSSQTTLPAGTTSFALVIFYANAILPATFTADLNGVSMTSLFHPARGTSEVVNLPLAPGRNVLKLSVDGQLPTRVATDTDRLVLQVP
jgi:hypothetical protein